MTMIGRWGATRLVVPPTLYFVIFFVLNPHLPSHFSSHFFFGGADGFQNAWNLWWVNEAAARFTLPWFTTLLHYPDGTTLLGHTLNPFNGVMAIVLLKFLSLVETYNTIVVFSFVMGGVTAFWLCLEVTRSYVGSLMGGAVFTFSSFHFMHADAHLQLAALEWLPLFVLCWIRFCESPTVARGVIAASVLFLVALCDLYYLAYSLIAGALFYIWKARQQRDAFFVARAGAGPVLGFLLPASLTSGALIAALLVQHARDPLTGTHSPRDLAMDLLSPFVWGYYWRFRDAVEPLWRPLSKHVTEASVYVGLSIVGMGIYALRRQSQQRIAYLPFWCAVAVFFGVMSLGPNLHVAGYEISLGIRRTILGHADVNLLVLPYAVFWLIFPPWRLAGVPLRMMVMVQLVAAVFAAGGLQALLNSTWRWKHAAALAFLGLLLVDYLPMPMNVTEPRVPAYVNVLKNLPDGAVLDLVSPAPQALFYQTVHRKPIAFGYVSRVPTSVDARDQALAAAIVSGRWEQVAREYRFKYIAKDHRAAELLIRNLNGAELVEIDEARRIYRGEGVSIYAF
ncbi:MAG: hypothetical protein ACRD2N_02825 [Vicinamibacterales bacterium]